MPRLRPSSSSQPSWGRRRRPAPSRSPGGASAPSRRSSRARRRAPAPPRSAQQLEVALPGELAGGDHRLDVAAVVRRRPRVLEDVLPERLLAHAPLGELDRAVDVPLRPVVDKVDREARVRAADVEQMRRRAREAGQLALEEDRDDDRDIRRVRRAEIRVVVEDHVAVVDVLAEERDHALDDLRHRAHEHRRRVRLGELVALGVEDPRAEILRLADDRRVAHPVQDAGHLLRDRREGAADHAHQDRRRELAPPAPSRCARRQSITMFPKRSISAARPGGTTVVESYCSTIAGPSIRSPARSSSRS